MVSGRTRAQSPDRIPPRRRHPWRRRLSALPGALVALSITLAAPVGCAADEDEEPEGIVEKVDTLVSDALSGNHFVIPMIISNPTMGSGAGLSAAIFYQLDDESRTSGTALGAYYTLNDSWIVALRQETYFSSGRHSLSGLAAAYRLNTEYFGIGHEAGRKGESADLSERGFGVEVNYERRISGPLYAGIMYRGGQVESALEEGASIELPPGEEDLVISGLGGTLTYDSRDHELHPGSGTLLEVDAVVMAAAFGSDADYEALKLVYRKYVGIGGSHVLAFRATGCFMAGDVPYLDLCYYGADSDLRGYVAGQYRDRAMYAVQAEGRFQVYRRLGAVAFAGVGGIAPELSEFRGDEILPSVGVGVRVVVLERVDLTVGLDYAVGRDSDGWYLRLGEAF